MNDLFKPLYKQHRRVAITDLDAVFDPLCNETVTQLGEYVLRFEDGKWTCAQLPGLKIIPGCLSTAEQVLFARESVVDYLEAGEHLTNLDAHYPELSRPLRMFGETKTTLPDAKHSAISDKLRWVTLGGQYNWTTKRYPSFEPGTPGCPLFPPKLRTYIGERFGIAAEAAIVNYYAEGDILSPHRDVAELSKRDLVSISLGCSCVFYVAMERDNTQPLPILLRSGDVVIMGSAARHAFHGVGRVFSNTAPSDLRRAPSVGDEFGQWIRNHRININVRQMR